MSPSYGPPTYSIHSSIERLPGAPSLRLNIPKPKSVLTANRSQLSLRGAPGRIRTYTMPYVPCRMLYPLSYGRLPLRRDDLLGANREVVPPTDSPNLSENLAAIVR